MWGAIIGDLAGSIYEYDQIKDIKPVKVTKLIEENSFFSDDTILTVAVLDAILNNQSYEFSLKKYAKQYENYKPDFTPYFKSPFSPGFTKWVNSNEKGLSTGNGAMMRIAPVGYLYNNEEEIIENAKKATIPSHNTIEAIEAATKIALIIFYARQGLSKEEIIKKLNIDIKFIHFKSFNYTCQDTIDNCIYAAFTSNSFEESIKKVISYGGDTDTNACIVGSIAEALYGIDELIIKKAKEKIPLKFVTLIEKAYTKIL